MRKRKTHLPKKALVILVGILLVALGSLLFFRIDRVEVVGPKIELKGMAYFDKRLIFLVNNQEAKEYIISRNPNIKSIEIVKVYPRTLRIRIEKSNILLGLKAIDGIIYISENSRVITKTLYQSIDTVVSGYPLVTSTHQYFLNQFAIGSQIEQKEITSTLFFLKKVGDELAFDIESIDIVNENMIVLHTDGLDLVFAVDRDKLIQFEELKFIVKKLGPRINEVKKIDIRFDKPLLTYT